MAAKEIIPGGSEWRILAQTIASLDHLPGWVRAYVLEDDRRGTVAYFEETTVCADYLEFLREQIALGVRGPEWTKQLESRLVALLPHAGKSVLNFHLFHGSSDYFLRLEADSKALIHAEEC